MCYFANFRNGNRDIRLILYDRAWISENFGFVNNFPKSFWCFAQEPTLSLNLPFSTPHFHLAPCYWQCEAVKIEIKILGNSLLNKSFPNIHSLSYKKNFALYFSFKMSKILGFKLRVRYLEMTWGLILAALI